MHVGPEPHERLDRVGHAVVHAGADRGEDRGARRRRLDRLRHPHRQAGHVGLDLAPQRPLRAAADDREPADVEPRVAHRVEDVAQRERAALEDRARHVVAGVREREPVEDAAGGAVPLGRHRALHARQEDEPLRAGIDVAGLRGEEVVRVAEADRFRVALDRRELVAPPPQVAARDEPGVLEQPGVGVGVRMALHEHRRILARFGARRADRLGGADHVADLAGLENAGAERGGHLVAAPDRDHGRGVEPARLGERGRHRADGLGARTQAGQHRLVDAGGLECG